MGMRDYASLYAHRYSTGGVYNKGMLLFSVLPLFFHFLFLSLLSRLAWRTLRAELLEDLLSNDALGDSGTLF